MAVLYWLDAEIVLVGSDVVLPEQADSAVSAPTAVAAIRRLLLQVFMEGPFAPDERGRVAYL